MTMDNEENNDVNQIMISSIATFGFHLLVSVIIPIYNVAPYLSEDLDSVVKQSYMNLEIKKITMGQGKSATTIIYFLYWRSTALHS